MGGKGYFFLIKLFLPAFAAPRGGGKSASCVFNRIMFINTFLLGFVCFMLSLNWIFKYRTLIKRKGNKLKEAHTFCCRYICLLSPQLPSTCIGRPLPAAQSEERLRVTLEGAVSAGEGDIRAKKRRFQKNLFRYVPLRKKGFRLPFVGGY